MSYLEPVFAKRTPSSPRCLFIHLLDHSSPSIVDTSQEPGRTQLLAAHRASLLRNPRVRFPKYPPKMSWKRHLPQRPSCSVLRPLGSCQVIVRISCASSSSSSCQVDAKPQSRSSPSSRMRQRSPGDCGRLDLSTVELLWGTLAPNYVPLVTFLEPHTHHSSQRTLVSNRNSCSRSRISCSGQQLPVSILQHAVNG